jgi:hypothetical protein
VLQRNIPEDWSVKDWTSCMENLHLGREDDIIKMVQVEGAKCIITWGPTEGPIRRTREGRSEWEKIKILLEGDGNYPSWPSPRSHWSATGPRNQHTTFQPENAVEHQTSSPLTNTGQTGEHHRSDRSLLVKLGDFHRKAPHRSGRWDTPVRPV